MKYKKIKIKSNEMKEDIIEINEDKLIYIEYNL